MGKRRCGIGVRGSPCVIPRPYLTKSVSSAMTGSSQLCLIWSGNGLVDLHSLSSLYDMLGVT